MNYKGGFLKWLEPVRPITGTEPKVPEAEVPEIHKAEAQAGLLRQEAIPPERKAIRIAEPIHHKRVSHLLGKKVNIP